MRPLKTTKFKHKETKTSATTVEHFGHAMLQFFHQRQGEKVTKINLLNRKLTKFLFFVLTGMNFSVTLLTIFLLLRTTFVTSCRASYSVQGQALQNHIFREETANRLVDCIALCTAHPGCHSSNFYRIEKRCELNDKTHASHPEDMVHVPYTIYMENIFRSCRNNLNCEGMPCAEVMLQFK